MKRFLKNYAERHQDRVNQVLHVFGVPITFVGTPIFAVMEQLWPALACFFGGYVLQFIGHAIEGNDAGETILFKKMLGKPYQEFGKHHASRQAG